MVVEKGYKQTEVGVIPEDWDLCKFDEITTAITCGVAATPKYVQESIGMPFLSASNVQNGVVIKDNYKFTSKAFYQQITKHNKPEFGDILYTRVGAGIGQAGIINFKLDFAIYVSLTLIKVKNNIDSGFIKQLLNSNFYQFLAKNSQFAGGGVQNLNVSVVKGFPIPVPPLPEQTAIANALSDMDALIAQTEKLIEKKKAIKQGVMQELLKPKEGWVTKKLGEVCEIIMGQSPLSEYYNFVGIGLPLIQGNADIKNRKTIIRTYSSNITKKGKLGDIIMTVRAPVGEIALSTFECCLGRGVCALRYENNFMYHYLLSIENYWSRLSSGSTFDSVNSNQIRDLSVTLPQTKNEQIEIAKTLTDLDNVIELTETKLQKLKHQKQGMMQALLTGKIRLI